jgi:transposase
MQHTTIAVDMAKSVFEIGISHRAGHVDKHHRLSRNQLSIFFAGQPPATVIMEACSSSHHWARQFMRFGHDVKLLPPFYVRPYVHRSKTDRTDGKGMLEAWRRSSTSPIAADFFRGAPATLRLIYVLLIMEIGTRRILHFNQCHITIGDGPHR